MRWLISGGLTEPQVKVLAGRLTVGETYFFRDKSCFDLLEQRVFPELTGSRRTGRRTLRVLSAGCCTGEEPYSIAMLLDRTISDRKDWDITILGTDINPLFLAKASEAVYGKWSFRDTPDWVRERYFTKAKENRFTLLPDIRKGVSFIYHNLAEEAPPTLSRDMGGIDLVLCRNVLMYLTPDHQRRAVRRLRQQLAEGGWLIVSPSEASDALFSDFVRVSFQGATFYRKGRKSLSPRREPAASVFRDHIVLAPPPEYQVAADDRAGPAEAGLMAAPPPAAPKPLAVETAPDPYKEALALYAKGAHGEAAEKLKALLSDSPQAGVAAALMARIFANQGRLPEALDLCEKAVGADRCNADHRYLLATVLQELGRLEQAVAELKKTLYLDQDFVLAHLLLGNLALRRRGEEGIGQALQECPYAAAPAAARRACSRRGRAHGRKAHGDHYVNRF